MARQGLEVAESVTVEAAPERVLAAFLDPRDLAAWWQVERSVTVSRPLGTYAVEWPATQYRDDILGRLGGAFHGTVMEYRPGRELFVADAYWNPPDGEPVGPLALVVRCDGSAKGTLVTVRLTGEDDGPRWQRYFKVMATGWPRALDALKRHLETETFRP